MPITVTLLPSPSRAAPATFSPRMDKVLSELGTFATEATALETNVNNLEIAAGVHATTATVQAVIATAQAVAAAASASSASLAANVVKWVSGTTYTEGAVVWSPVNFAGYRRQTTGAGTTDPSADPTNWACATLSGTVTAPSITAPANNATGVLEQPTITTSAFAMTGDVGDVAHYATQWQVRTAAGNWTTPAYDSGEDTSNKLSLVLPAGILSAGSSEYYIRARHRGTIWGWSAYSAEIHITTAAVFASIVGVCCTATGGGGGTWVHIDSAGNTISTPATSVFNAHQVWGGMAAQTIDSQSMIKIPKFYYKRAVISGGANNGKEGWWISDVLMTGFAIHPAFRSDSADIDQIYVGKYQAHDDGTKLESHSGTAPVVSISLTTSIAHAAARNAGGVTGFMLWSVYHCSVIQWLYLVENATMDSQTKTGTGRVNESSAANVDATDVAQATYRGIVGLWGNVYQWMDGLKTASGSAAISLWDRDGNKNWVSTGQIPPNLAVWSYPLTFISANGAGYDFDGVFINATGHTTNSNATAPDGQYFSAVSECFPCVGGAWDDAASAGLWSVSCGHAASSAFTSFGARLAKV